MLDVPFGVCLPRFECKTFQFSSIQAQKCPHDFQPNQLIHIHNKHLSHTHTRSLTRTHNRLLTIFTHEWRLVCFCFLFLRIEYSLMNAMRCVCKLDAWARARLCAYVLFGGLFVSTLNCLFFRLTVLVVLHVTACLVCLDNILILRSTTRYNILTTQLCRPRMTGFAYIIQIVWLTHWLTNAPKTFAHCECENGLKRAPILLHKQMFILNKQVIESIFFNNLRNTITITAFRCGCAMRFQPFSDFPVDDLLKVDWAMNVLLITRFSATKKKWNIIYKHFFCVQKEIGLFAHAKSGYFITQTSQLLHQGFRVYWGSLDCFFSFIETRLDIQLLNKTSSGKSQHQ